MDQLSAPRILDGASGNPKQGCLVFLQHEFLHPLARGELAGWDMAPSQISALSKNQGAEGLVASTLLRASASAWFLRTGEGREWHSHG